MKKAIIFDFNRTLYIPEIGKIPEETIELLKQLKKQGILLALISQKEGNRKEIIENSGIAELFSAIKFVEEKNEKVFREVLEELGCNAKDAIVVGDRIKSEIRAANELGIKTIWYRNGKFKDEIPEKSIEEPEWTISRLDAESFKSINL